MTDKELTRAEVVAFMKMRDMQPSHYKMGRQLLRCMDERDKAAIWATEQHACADNYALRLGHEKARAEAAEQRVATLEAVNARLREALLWCSGSDDFNEGGFAREGWLKLCAPLLKGDDHE